MWPKPLRQPSWMAAWAQCLGKARAKEYRFPAWKAPSRPAKMADSPARPATCEKPRRAQDFNGPKRLPRRMKFPARPAPRRVNIVLPSAADSMEWPTSWSTSDWRGEKEPFKEFKISRSNRLRAEAAAIAPCTGYSDMMPPPHSRFKRLSEGPEKGSQKIIDLFQ